MDLCGLSSLCQVQTMIATSCSSYEDAINTYEVMSLIGVPEAKLRACLRLPFFSTLSRPVFPTCAHRIPFLVSRKSPEAISKGSHWASTLHCSRGLVHCKPKTHPHWRSGTNTLIFTLKQGIFALRGHPWYHPVLSGGLSLQTECSFLLFPPILLLHAMSPCGTTS